MSDKNSTRVKKAIARLNGAEGHLVLVRDQKATGVVTAKKRDSIKWSMNSILNDVRNAKTLLRNMKQRVVQK